MANSNKKMRYAFTTFTSFILCANAFASTPNLRIDGTIDSYVPFNQLSSRASTDSTTGQHIVFEKVILSSSAKQWLATHNTETPALLNTETDMLPKQVNLGMNNVPVLDQGRHGTCVTFATSGALDAIRGEGDYVSQLCNLELGSFLAKKDNNYPSGWDGSWADYVLNQVTQYGVISLASQRQMGCANVYEYPLNDENNHGRAMPASRFSHRSDRIMKDISFNTILNHEDAFSANGNMNTALISVKKALNKGHRVLIGTLLDDRLGHNGALGTNKIKNDTWMLTPAISEDAKNKTITAGHEMIIIGYDDNAQVVSADHQKQTGVIVLRNSWGSGAGDHGNYYMTYAHFKTLVMELNEIIPVSDVSHV